MLPHKKRNTDNAALFVLGVIKRATKCCDQQEKLQVSTFLQQGFLIRR